LRFDKIFIFDRFYFRFGSFRNFNRRKIDFRKSFYNVWNFRLRLCNFFAIVNFDAETEEMVFAVYENTSVTWQDSSRGAMNALLSGQYTNVEGKTYYNSGVGNVICRAKLSEDGLTADLTPGSVTSAGAPAFFYNIRWYGRYTNSSGSRSGVSWTGYETALPNVMTKQ